MDVPNIAPSLGPEVRNQESCSFPGSPSPEANPHPTLCVHFFGEMEQEGFCSPGGCGQCGHQGVGGL